MIDLGILRCGRCETIRTQLRRERDHFDEVAIRSSNGGLIHLVSKWNRRSVCGYYQGVVERMR